MLIIFSVNDQKITHDLKGQLVAGSVDIVQAAFKFDSSWDELDKIVVFTSSACPKPVPVQFADEAFYIPKDVLKPGKLYVSVVGFGLDGRKKTTQKWDIMQAITVQKCGDGGDCDLVPNIAACLLYTRSGRRRESRKGRRSRRYAGQGVRQSQYS